MKEKLVAVKFNAHLRLATYSLDRGWVYALADSVVFRYPSPLWLKKYKFILHRTCTRDGTINPAEFKVSEYSTGLGIGIHRPTRDLAKKFALKRIIEAGEKLFRTKVRTSKKVNK